MKTVSLDFQQEIAVLRLSSGVTNPIAPRLVKDLTAALDSCRNACRGLMLAGGTKFFSIGFDLPGLLPLGRKTVAEFYDEFNRVALELFCFPVPTICAIAGHAIAGGTILALTCDYRFAAGKKTLLGLNEIKLGVPVPHLADLMLRQLVSERDATDILYHGRFLPAADACKIGLVDTVCTPERLESEALEKLFEMAALPPTAFAQIKESRVEAVRSQFLREHPRKMDGFLDCWFTPAVRKLLTEAAKKF